MTKCYHWQRFDGSFDSICRRCVKIIAHADTEEELAELEKDHICDRALSSGVVCEQ
jgi:hypothetical protein